MNLIDAFIGEYQHEMGVTRRVLDRVPDDKLAWKPHDKSMTMGRLASHTAEISGWVPGTITLDAFDLGSQYKPFDAKSKAEILATFDKLVADAVQVLKSGVSNETLMKKWALMSGSHTVFELPKAAVLRSFVMSHIIHHRGQLSVYLRLTGAAVPSIYGPSADEQG